MTKQAYRESQRVAPLGEAGIAALREIVESKSCAKVNEVFVDLFSASGILSVYDQLNEKNQESFRKLRVGKAASFAFQVINDARKS